MSAFEPISSSQLKSLVKVRTLLDKLGPSQNNPRLVEFLQGTADDNDNTQDKKFPLVKEEAMDINDDEQPPEKKVKIEKKEEIEIDISALLIECPDLSTVWAKMNSDGTSIANRENISEDALARLMNALTVKHFDNTRAFEYFQTLMVKSILHFKIYQKSYESFFEAFLTLYPPSCYPIASQLVMEPNLSTLMVFIINLDLMNEDQELLILLKWLSKFSIESETLELPEIILSKNSKLYEDNQLVVSLAASFAAGKSESSAKCVKFTKFLLQVLSKVGSIDETAAKSFKYVMERNKTFLRKRLEMELNRKCST